MLEIILDSNTFQKIYDYSKNKTNNDEIIDVEKIYKELIENKNHEKYITIYCLYEIFVKSFYKNQIKKILEFLRFQDIKILQIDKGKIIKFEIKDEDINNLDEESTYLRCLSLKKDLEKCEIIEYLNYLILIIINLLIDYLTLKFAESNFYLENLKEIILTLFKNNEIHLKKIIKNFISNEIDEYYKDTNKKQRLKQSIMDISNKIFSEIYYILKKKTNNTQLNKIIDDEIYKLTKLNNKLEYVKNLINNVEKNYNIKYLEKINERYLIELKDLNYPLNFNKYFLNILFKIIYNSNFDKNDATDNTLFLFYSTDTFILTFDKTICKYLRDEHFKNYDFIRKFYK